MFKFKNKYNEVILVLLGILMSPMSTYMFHRSGIPIVAPELVFIPYLVTRYNKHNLSFVAKLNFKDSFIWTFILCLLSLILQDITIDACLSTARSFFIVFMFYEIGKSIRLDENCVKVCLWISTGAVLGWCLNNYLLIGTAEYFASNGILYGNMIAIPIAFACSLIYMKNYWLFGALFISNIYLSVTSGLRRQIAVSLLAALFSFLFANISGFSLKKQIVTISIIFGFVSSLPFLDNYLQNNNDLIYARVVQRTEKVLEGDVGKGDETRSNNFSKFIDDAGELMIPHGFVSFQTSKGGRGVFVDSPTYMLSYTFGFLPFLLFLVLYIKKLVWCFRMAFFRRSKEYGFVLITSSIVFFLLFVESSMFSFSFTAPMTGFIIGLLFRKDILPKINNTIS